MTKHPILQIDYRSAFGSKQTRVDLHATSIYYILSLFVDASHIQVPNTGCIITDNQARITREITAAASSQKESNSPRTVLCNSTKPFRRHITCKAAKSVNRSSPLPSYKYIDMPFVMYFPFQCVINIRISAAVWM